MSNNKSFIEEALASEYADPDPAFDGDPPAMEADPPSIEDIPGVGASGADVDAIPGVGDGRQSARVDDIPGVGEPERAFGGMPMLADGSDPDADAIPGTSGGGFGADIGSDDTDDGRDQPLGTEAGFAASDGDELFSDEDAQAGREAVAEEVRSTAERVRDRLKGGRGRGRRRTVGSVRRKDSGGGIVGAIRDRVGGGDSNEEMDSTRVVGSFGSSNDDGDASDDDREGLDAAEVELDDEDNEDDDDSDEPSSGRRGLDASEVNE